MFIFTILFFLLIILNGITTIPLSIPFLVVSAVVLKKPRVFLLAFILGLFLDFTMLRVLGQTGLVFTVFVFLLFLYERKFETQTLTFVFISSFLGSLAYLMIFGYNQILLQAFLASLLAILIFETCGASNRMRHEAMH